MEMIVSKESDVEAKINLQEFRKALKKTLEIEKSFKTLVKIHKNSTGLEEEEVKHMMFQGTDWGQVMKFINFNKAKEIKIGLNKCIIDSLRQYSPGKAMINGDATYTFEEEDIDTEEYMVIHNFVPLMEHHIDRFLGDFLFDYADKKWEIQRV